MNSGKTNLCNVEQIGKKYSVTWNEHITGLSLYSDKVPILLDMITKDAKSWDVGVVLSNGYVMWLSCTLLATLNTSVLAEYLHKVGRVENADQILGAVFDNMDDVNMFTDRLEKKYIVYLLKK